MKKNLLYLSLAAMMLAMPVSASAEPLIEIMEMAEPDTQDVTITVINGQLVVEGAQGQTIEVYNVAGTRIIVEKADSDSKHIDLGRNKGCFIVKVGKIVRKISVR